MSRTEVLISVAVPVYNRELFIGRCVRSIVDQDCIDVSRIEIIIADDGSTDDTVEVVRNIDVTPAHVELIELSHIGEPGSVRNHALRRARGALIAYCDSDDFWLPHHLATVMCEFDRDYDLAMVATAWGFAHFIPQPDGTIRNEYRVRPHPIDTVNTNCRVHRRECLDAVGYFGDARWGEDQDFFARIEQHFKTTKVPIVTNVNGYIKGGNNVTYCFDDSVKRVYH
ncbi:MAG: glycosyltransferase family 2 protein [Planctomycetes bacterium]|nr:glycosyltransferase family 2 protein [Planctomycetota bacterium]